jgi:hypothetical protein
MKAAWISMRNSVMTIRTPMTMPAAYIISSKREASGATAGPVAARTTSRPTMATKMLMNRLFLDLEGTGFLCMTDSPEYETGRASTIFSAARRGNLCQPDSGGDRAGGFPRPSVEGICGLPGTSAKVR